MASPGNHQSTSGVVSENKEVLKVRRKKHGNKDKAMEVIRKGFHLSIQGKRRNTKKSIGCNRLKHMNYAAQMSPH